LNSFFDFRREALEIILKTTRHNLEDHQNQFTKQDGRKKCLKIFLERKVFLG